MNPDQKTTLLVVRRLEFTRNEGDTKATGRVLLDTGITYRITLRWLPQSESWVLDMATTDGKVIVTGAWVRDRTDCLLGVSTAGRPPGAIMSYNPKSPVDPDLDAWTTGGAVLVYVPAGLRPEDFNLYGVVSLF